MSGQLVVLSGGAAQGLVGDLTARFKAETGHEIAATFGAVGAMRDELRAGAPADLLILTRALIDALTVQGHVVPGSAVDIGTVATAVAVRSGDTAPAVDDPAQLSAALLAADEIYLPDPTQATAGIHVAGVLDRLGFAPAVASRLMPFGNSLALGLNLAGLLTEQLCHDPHWRCPASQAEICHIGRQGDRATAGRSACGRDRTGAAARLGGRDPAFGQA